MSKFWDDLLGEDTVAIREEYDELWELAQEGGVIPQEQAQRTLTLMFSRTHLDIRSMDPGNVHHFPTEQGGPWNKLVEMKRLWWVDHATAGVSARGTLGWFSSKRRTKTKSFTSHAEAEAFAWRVKSNRVIEGNGVWIVHWKGYAGAVTHFVVDMNGIPYYILDIKHRCWGEPRRNRDGIHVEMVNPLVCHKKGNDWHFWAGKIPDVMLNRGQIPVDLDKPFRGANYMMPYTWSQVVTNITLKRICIAATGRMDRFRMSEHTDWRKSKYDMGPLWPRKLINDAAFENLPCTEYDFMKQFVNADGQDDIVSPKELIAIEDGNYDLLSPELHVNRGVDTLELSEEHDIPTVRDIQLILIDVEGPGILPVYGADGFDGEETRIATLQFQRDWNHNKPTDTIDVDGIAGVETLQRLREAAEMGPSFRHGF